MEPFGSINFADRDEVVTRKRPNCVRGHIFLARDATTYSTSAVAGIMERDDEHHNNDDLPDHAHLPLGSTEAAHHGMATAGALTARVGWLKRRNIARHRHHALRRAP